MNFIRKLLFPFALLYDLITKTRNFFFDKGIFKSYSFGVPLIAIGNLSVGGTGKTPQIEYLIRLLTNHHRVATLSRGYKRTTKGFVLADPTANAQTIGDEPYQFYNKFPNIQVAVDANRKKGIEKLLLQQKKPEIILLDDAFQHRKVFAGLYILLTTYSELYADDFLLPTGNLRESKSGAKRAQLVVVTKCPENLSLMQQTKIKNKLKLTPKQSLFFSTICYDDTVFGISKSIKIDQIKNRDKILLAGIAKPDLFFTFLKTNGDTCLQYPDHHHFSPSDIATIKKLAQNKPIITTEKDYVRLRHTPLASQLYYLPIKTKILSNTSAFDALILNYIQNQS